MNRPDTLQSNLTVIVCPPVSLQCLYCEKTFRDKTTLKDHMRKKAHRRINASNHEYDRFYVINYLVRLQPEYSASTQLEESGPYFQKPKHYI